MQASFGVCRNCCRTGCSTWKQRTHCSRIVFWQKNDLAGFFLSIRHTSQGIALLSFCTFVLDFYSKLKTSRP